MCFLPFLFSFSYINQLVFVCISVQFYTSPKQIIIKLRSAYPSLIFSTQHHCCTLLLYSILYLAYTYLCPTLLRQCVTSHCPAALLLYLTMRNLSLLCQNVSTLFYSITLPFSTSQYHSDTLLCYASPKQIITQQFCTFALPIITTISSHAVAYFVLLFHMNVPFLVERFLLIAFEIVQGEIPKYLAASFADGNVFPDSKCFTDFLWLYP